MNFSQEGLAKRAGVSWSSLKRFEYTGLVSLDSLLRLALVLGCLDDFEQVCVEDSRGVESRTPPALSPHRLDGPGHRPFTAVTRVRIPLGTPKKNR